MRTRSFVLAVLGTLVLVALLAPSPPRGEQHAALAAGGAVTLMSGQSVPGVGLASLFSAVTPTDRVR